MKTIKRNVIIDSKIFKQFALYDGFYIKQILKSPLIFFLIMSLSALGCFAMHNRAEQAAMLGFVLLAVGICLPAAYIGNFILSIHTQIKKLGLSTPKKIYSLQFSREPDGIMVSYPGGESLRFQWADLFGIYRVRGCMYIYVAKNKAFLVPEEKEDDELWSFLSEMTPKN